MSNLHTKTKKYAKEDYDSMPIHYCHNCLSLKVMRVAKTNDMCYCDECGGTNIEETSIKKWSTLYREKYGFLYVNK